LTAERRHIALELKSKLSGREALYFLPHGRVPRGRSAPKITLGYYVDEPFYDEAIRLSRIRDGQTALDVYTGNPICGVSAIYLKAAAPGARVIGIDKSPRLIEVARENAAILGVTGVEFGVGDDEALEFADGTFDVIVNRLGLHWAQQASVALGESFRVLKPGGRFLFLDIVAPADEACRNWLKQIYNHHYYLREEVDAMFAEARLIEEERVHWPFVQPIEAMGFADEAARSNFIAAFAAAPARCKELYRIAGAGDTTQFELDLTLAAYVKPG
jgi:ubiquinone/menaquinone biosynthesis C-methylase UbiE